MRNIATIENIEEFLSRFIDSHIGADIRKLIQINKMHETSYPYLALAFSGVDFFGALEKGFEKGNVGKRFCWFIKEWMGEVNPLYKKDCVGKLIYYSCRNGILHNAILKNSFNVSSYLYPKCKHLHLLPDSRLIFFHSIQFAEDFLAAQKIYRKQISTSKDKEYIKGLCSNLNKMLQENRKENRTDTQKLIRELESMNRIVDEEIQPANQSTITTSSTSSVTTSSSTTHTAPPTWDE